MPRGKCEIYNWTDTYDIKTTWGVSLSDGAISTLLAPPAAKERVSNTSRLENGKRIDNTTPMRYESRELTLEMHLIANDFPTLLANYRNFLEAITSSPEGIKLFFYNIYGLTSSNKLQFNLKYLSCTPFAVYGGTLAKFAIRFVEENPNFGLPPVSRSTGDENNNEEETE